MPCNSREWNTKPTPQTPDDVANAPSARSRSPMVVVEPVELRKVFRAVRTNTPSAVALRSSSTGPTACRSDTNPTSRPRRLSSRGPADHRSSWSPAPSASRRFGTPERPPKSLWVVQQFHAIAKRTRSDRLPPRGGCEPARPPVLTDVRFEPGILQLAAAPRRLQQLRTIPRRPGHDDRDAVRGEHEAGGRLGDAEA